MFCDFKNSISLRKLTQSIWERKHYFDVFHTILVDSNLCKVRKSL